MRRISVSLFLLFLICLAGPCLNGQGLLSVIKAQAEDGVAVNALSHYIVAGIYERLDRLEEAVRQYKAAVRADPQSPLLHLNLAVALTKQNNFQKAIPELKRAIQLASIGLSQPESLSIEAHTILALIYSIQGNLSEAAGEYESALRGALVIDPQNIRIHRSLGRIYLQQRKFSEAEKTYRFILNIIPSDSKAHFYLGNIYDEQGKRQEAIGEFKLALEFEPEYADALNSLGYIYAEESINLEEAEAMIGKALEYEPNNGAYIDSLGWVYFKQGKHQQAIEELERATHFLDDAVIYEHLGDVYFNQGNLEKARQNWQKSLEMDSREDPPVKEKLGNISELP